MITTFALGVLQPLRRSRARRSRRRSAPGRRRCARRRARRQPLPATSACRSRRGRPGSTPSRFSASAICTVSRESSAKVHSRRAPSSPRKTAADASGVRLAQAWRQAVAMFSRAPSNHVVHSIPRESFAHVVPGPRELELEVVGDGAPEALGLLDRDAVEGGVVSQPRARARRTTFAASSCAAVGDQANLTSGLAITNLVVTNVRRRELHGSPNLFRGTAQVVDARRRLLRPLHDHAGQHGGERGPAGDPGGPRHRPLRAPVDRHRLRAQLRRADADRRQARRRLRPPADLRHRDRRSSPPRRSGAGSPTRGTC